MCRLELIRRTSAGKVEEELGDLANLSAGGDHASLGITDRHQRWRDVDAEVLDGVDDDGLTHRRLGQSGLITAVEANLCVRAGQ